MNSHLRDRLLSQSPDPIKSSILRESGMGWNPGLQPSQVGSVSSTSSSELSEVTEPLRIAKRDSPASTANRPAVARRSSSSYKHMHSNNLVSKSPFKSQIPTPGGVPARPISITFPTTTRRVSAEKRPRPVSLHDQAEADSKRPFALKRDRKQSTGLNNLLQRETVTKSPFRTASSSSSVRSPLPPPPPLPLKATITQPSYIPATPTHIPVPAQSKSGTSPSPGRSALVSRRMHGPRLSGSGRRERRKTVTFDERCDVLEFDRDEPTDDEVFESYSEGEEEHSFDASNSELSMEVDDFYENEPEQQDEHSTTDADPTMAGIVDKMFSPADARDETPPRNSPFPPDIETEDGVPLGRSHHVERFLQHQQHLSPHTQTPPHFSPNGSSPHHISPRAPGSYPFNFNLPNQGSPIGAPATPPVRRSPAVSHVTPPLGRSPHVERIRHARQSDQPEMQSDVHTLPSPVNPTRRQSMDDALVSQCDPDSRETSTVIGPDLFEHPLIQDELAPSESSFVKSANVSAESNALFNKDPGGTESDDTDDEVPNDDEEHLINNARVTPNASPNASFQRAQSASPSPFARARSASPFNGSPLRTGSPLRAGSPLTRAGSPFAQHPFSPLRNGTQSPDSLRPRISKEDVKRRMLNRHSFTEGPSPSPPPEHSFPSRQSPMLSSHVEEEQEDEEELEREETVSELHAQVLSPATDAKLETASIMTGITDISIETSVVAHAERAKVSVASLIPTVGEEFDEEQDVSMEEDEDEDEREFGLRPSEEREALDFDLGSKFSLGGLGFSASAGDLSATEIQAALSSSTNQPSRPGSGMRMGNQDVDMDMKSALDRLMEDVAGGPVDENMMDDSFTSQDSNTTTISADSPPPAPPMAQRTRSLPSIPTPTRTSDVKPKAMERADTEPVFERMMAAPPPPVRDIVKEREALILAKRRAARRALEQEEEDEEDEDEDEGSGSEEEEMERPRASRKLGAVRPKGRRSRSTGDVAQRVASHRIEGNLLDVANMEDDSLLGKIEKELNKAKDGREPTKKKYHIRHHGTIYASSTSEKVTHTTAAGDIDSGRAWRTVRRPSDMNEYAKQIREYRSQDKGKAYGKVFVKVLAVKGVHLPLPREKVSACVTLNNGIHFVSTPEFQLMQDCSVEQEFELIEHSKLEFTLAVKIKKDPVIAAQFRALEALRPAAHSATPMPPPMVTTLSKSSGMFGLFSSPKKPKDRSRASSIPAPPPPAPPAPHRLPENLARYLKQDGTMARAFVSFKDVVHRCDTRLFETSFPLIGQRAELGGKFSTQNVGEIVLQMFRLPPLPGIPPDQIPQSLDECHRGLRHINWHKLTYYAGTLTQSGGDCSTWRRRTFRVVGGTLVAYSDVTKKAVATIDLKKAIGLQDDNDISDRSRYEGSLYGVERSFRLIFPQGEEIMFFADTDDEKSKWLEVLRALVGHIPPHPLWAELLWQRQEDMTKRMQAARQTATPAEPAASGSSQQAQQTYNHPYYQLPEQGRQQR